MKTLVGGAVAAALGLIGLGFWWKEFLTVLGGTIPAVLLLGGGLAIYLGFDEMKDTWKKEEPAAPSMPADDLEKYKSEISDLKKELENLKADPSRKGLARFRSHVSGRAADPIRGAALFYLEPTSQNASDDHGLRRRSVPERSYTPARVRMAATASRSARSFSSTPLCPGTLTRRRSGNDAMARRMPAMRSRFFLGFQFRVRTPKA